jgi:hypothetical protein
MAGPAKNAERRKREISSSKPDNLGQFKRFIEMAREIEVDESPDAIDRAFNKVVRPKKKPKPDDLSSA